MGESLQLFFWLSNWDDMMRISAFIIPAVATTRFEYLFQRCTEIGRIVLGTSAVCPS